MLKEKSTGSPNSGGPVDFYAQYAIIYLFGLLTFISASEF